MVHHRHCAGVEPGIIHHDTVIVGETMKRFAFVSGFLLVTSAIAVPMYFWRKIRLEQKENLRYDIADYFADESL